MISIFGQTRKPPISLALPIEQQGIQYTEHTHADVTVIHTMNDFAQYDGKVEALLQILCSCLFCAELCQNIQR